MSIPLEVSNAEHLKAIMQDVLSAFQTGAGVDHADSCPMTFDLALKMLSKEIDQICYSQDVDYSDLVKFRLYKKEASFEELDLILRVCGEWIIRSNKRKDVTYANVAGKVKKNTTIASVLGFLKTEGWEVTDFSVGL